ncbi:DUF6284 family protein [Streptomyces cacaoi]|uniref:DUF6284 family protein n=1 Tax=Streptomyces cacaoi TaxID=1898 RepID=UPI002623A5EC|nr:DUF6284 family protein [Streptomyces cacaoi]
MNQGITHAAAEYAPWPEPTDADLAAIEREMPVLTAETELLDAYIQVLGRPATELDERRIRRARRRLLAARTALTNHTARTQGGAA